MSKVCDMDCLNCKFDDCIKNDVYYDGSSYKNRSESAKKHAREYQAMLRKEAREKGLCIVCRKEPAAFDHVVCKHCKLKASIRQKMKYEKKRREKEYSDECRFCSRKKMPGKKVCELHYQIYCEAARKARESKGFKKYMEKMKEAETRRVEAWREYKETNGL